MTQAAPVLSPFFAVVVANDVSSLVKASGSFSTVLVSADDAKDAKRRARASAFLVTSCSVHAVSIYGMRFHGGNRILHRSGAVTIQEHWTA